MLWQLWCHCNPDHDTFSFTVVAIFPNVCLWRRSLCSNLVLTLKNCIEPPSYASTAYVVAIWPSFLFNSFVKIWDTCENFLGKSFNAPPWQKFPVRLVVTGHESDHDQPFKSLPPLPGKHARFMYLKVFPKTSLRGRKGRGRGNLGARGRKERHACKDAIVFSIFHAQILRVK